MSHGLEDFVQKFIKVLCRHSVKLAAAFSNNEVIPTVVDLDVGTPRLFRELVRGQLLFVSTNQFCQTRNFLLDFVDSFMLSASTYVESATCSVNHRHF